MPSFKDILQKLSVFKNNLSLLIPVIIELVSVLLFIPTQLMSSKLQKHVRQESISQGIQRVERLEQTAVSSEQYEKEAERQKAHAADANEIAKLARQTTQRELLSYVIFPQPDPNGFSGLLFQEFGQRYRSVLDNLVLRVNGRDCPTDTEIERGLENASVPGRPGAMGLSMQSAMGDDMGRGLYGGDMYGDMYGGSMRFGNLNRMIIDEMCEARAKKISVYVNPLDIAGYEYWKEYKSDVTKEDALRDCWYHQLAYWIIKDIFATIEAMNSDYDNAMEAPVKRFMGITFTMGLKRPVSEGGGSAVIRSVGRSRKKQQKREDADMPVYARNPRDGLSESLTARYCNEENKGIDVTHFSFSVVVDAKSVLPFMKELCSEKEHQFRGYPDPNQPVQTFEPVQTFKHNQITVLESKMGAINSNDMTHRYYRYGDEPVVTLDLVCEYLFDVAAYEKLLPQPVLDDLAGKSEDKKR